MWLLLLTAHTNIWQTAESSKGTNCVFFLSFTSVYVRIIDCKDGKMHKCSTNAKCLGHAHLHHVPVTSTGAESCGGAVYRLPAQTLTYLPTRSQAANHDGTLSASNDTLKPNLSERKYNLNDSNHLSEKCSLTVKGIRPILQPATRGHIDAFRTHFRGAVILSYG